jgi:hypothetical protein
MERFTAAADKGIVYQWGVWKNTLATMPDTTQFKKRTANNDKDNGKYAANQALLLRAAAMGCGATCLSANNANAPNKPPIRRDSQGTSVTGQCAPCANLFVNLKQATRPAAPIPPTPKPSALAGSIGGQAGQEIALPDLEGADAEVADYPDEDGSPRDGRPSDAPTTTTSYPIVIVYRAPGGGAGGSGGVGVVGAASSSWLHGGLFMLLAVAFGCCS